MLGKANMGTIKTILEELVLMIKGFPMALQADPPLANLPNAVLTSVLAGVQAVEAKVDASMLA
ncbi:hypothetical protein CROQUDRAFT_98645 [Cronartium quercuum f. sp. fusiforme G11]|uniref:Uncharacterized protein n=1 Tax=Cronartium quercuum f. sp. fusiforme G11 TaxID=708437 RepID=A0A9P6N8F5_9BASI|nr:hypothetical protein CROQUDRAFT_98645 [Cronartium quercuum f. sp. fusiforme G11]